MQQSKLGYKHTCNIHLTHIHKHDFAADLTDIDTTKVNYNYSMRNDEANMVPCTVVYTQIHKLV